MSKNCHKCGQEIALSQQTASGIPAGVQMCDSIWGQTVVLCFGCMKILAIISEWVASIQKQRVVSLNLLQEVKIWENEQAKTHSKRL